MLLSVAGSGKTRCVIEKMRYLALKNVCTKKQMLVFSFSKLATESMKHRCSEYQDATVFCEPKGNIKTIDSFCKYMMEKVEASIGDAQGTTVGVLSSKALELI